MILTEQAGDTRHPAFNKLFIESEYVPELNLQIFKRRARSKQEKPVFMGHMLVNEGNPRSEPAGDVRHESDRAALSGAGALCATRLALESPEYLTGTTGATLDPIFCPWPGSRTEPHGSAELAYLTFAGESREAVLNLAARYRSWSLVERTFQPGRFRRAGLAGQAGF